MSHDREPGDSYKNIAEWVERDGCTYATEPVECVVARLTMKELMETHSAATIKLCGPIPDTERVLWQEALEAVCKEIGDRFNRLTHQAEEYLPRQIRALQRG